MGIIGKARERASDFKGQAAQLSTGATEAGAKRRRSAAFNAALPVIRSAGWALEEVTLGLGLPPEVVAKFKTVEQRSDAELDEIIAQNADRKLAVRLLKSLRYARQISGKVHVGGLTTQGIAIGLGLVPVDRAQTGLVLRLPRLPLG